MFGLGLPELIIILVILLLLFGATRLPKLARSIGESVGELQKGAQKGFDGTKTSKKSPKTTTKKES